MKNNMNSRMENCLKSYVLVSGLFYPDSEHSTAYEVDFEYATSVISVERAKSQKFLKDALEKPL